ncbi:cysteine hydrolase [Limosilactobacillus reuteri]|uniref:cysteine hydrolase family protein n=1 Tax=Limosilactobacillus reuteri TaxID=1598 RepID=UPI001E38615B|nr:cysteine hydrolase family protein [Limosilactobacillus reuteri]MCC4436718.1 cysteine hydrolase [Limosilactobacillus reuteri]MCC4438873.1 cysteine hydrolase [Limosilactobacillus reuteri]MCC4442880.1 cysteine hydrolase [Limosilactobacillus reuteri]MCC4444857.1 cysteine hydrolase [Limosilactobacillus reuteri]MCC4446833.1 cysteine hydrolase [Limosilactobacillus reuteri]
MAKSALIIIDLQNGVCKSDQVIFNYENLISKINRRIDYYRSQNFPIIFIQHEDNFLQKNSTAWQLVSDLHYKKNDILLSKKHPNSFYQTHLEKILENLGINNLEICGAQTEYCVDATIKMAHGLGYQVIMQHNTSSTFDNKYMTAEDTINFFENIWNNRFLTFI